MTPDQVCEYYAERNVKIMIKDLDEEHILIEGDCEALLFLAELIEAQAKAFSDGCQISPFGAGKALFKRGARRGVYIHRKGAQAEATR